MSCIWGTLQRAVDPDCTPAAAFAQPLINPGPFGSLLLQAFSDAALTAGLAPTVAVVTRVTVWTSPGSTCDFCDWATRHASTCLVNPAYSSAWGADSNADSTAYPTTNDVSLTQVLDSAEAYSFDPTSADLFSVLSALYASGSYERVARLRISTDAGDLTVWIADTGCY